MWPWSSQQTTRQRAVPSMNYACFRGAAIVSIVPVMGGRHRRSEEGVLAPPPLGHLVKDFKKRRLFYQYYPPPFWVSLYVLVTGLSYCFSSFFFFYIKSHLSRVEGTNITDIVISSIKSCWNRWSYKTMRLVTRIGLFLSNFYSEFPLNHTDVVNLQANTI